MPPTRQDRRRSSPSSSSSNVASGDGEAPPPPVPQDPAAATASAAPSSSPSAAKDITYFDALHRTLLSHIRRGNHLAVLTVLALPQVHGDPLFWGTCTYPTGLVAAILATSHKGEEEKEGGGAERGADGMATPRSVLRLTLPDEDEDCAIERSNASGEAPRETPTGASPLSLSEVYLLLQWCHQQRQALRRLERGWRAGLSEMEGEHAARLPDTSSFLLPPTTQMQQQRFEEGGDDGDDDDDDVEVVAATAGTQSAELEGEEEGDVPSTTRHTRKRRRGTAASLEEEYRSSTAEAADLAVEVTLRRTLARIEEPTSEELQAAQGGLRQAGTQKRTSRDGIGEQKEARGEEGGGADGIDLAQLCRLLRSQCQFVEFTNPLVRLAAATATTAAAAADTVPVTPDGGHAARPALTGAELLSDPFSPPDTCPAPTQDLIHAPSAPRPLDGSVSGGSHRGKGQAPQGDTRQAGKHRLPTPPAFPSSSSSLSASLPLAQRSQGPSPSPVPPAAAVPLSLSSLLGGTVQSSPDDSSHANEGHTTTVDSIQLLQSLQPLPGSQRVVASFDDLVDAVPTPSNGNDHDDGDETVDSEESQEDKGRHQDGSVAAPLAQGSPSAPTLPSHSTDAVGDPLPPTQQPAGAVATAIEAFDAFNLQQEQQWAGRGGGEPQPRGPQRRMRFTPQEDDAILRGIAQYGQRAGAFQYIHKAFLGVWRPNRTPTHLYDHWRDALRAKALQPSFRPAASGPVLAGEPASIAAAATAAGGTAAPAQVNCSSLLPPPPQLTLVGDTRRSRGVGDVEELAAPRTLPRGIRPTAPAKEEGGGGHQAPED